MFTLAQISDPHLGAGTALFRSNFDAVVQHLTAEPPDLIVATGDVSLEGADSEADMAFAAASLAEASPCRSDARDMRHRLRMVIAGGARLYHPGGRAAGRSRRPG